MLYVPHVPGPTFKFHVGMTPGRITAPCPQCNIVVCGLPGKNNSSQPALWCGVRTAEPQSVSAPQCKHSPVWFRNTLTLLAGIPAPEGLSCKLLTISKELFMGLGRLKRFRDFYRLTCGHSWLNPTLDVRHLHCCCSEVS